MTDQLKPTFTWKKKHVPRQMTSLLFPDQILKAFFHYTTDAISISNMDNRIVLVNQAFEQYYGWSLEELDASPYCFIPDELVNETRQLFDAVRSMGVHLTNYETVRKRKDGTLVEVTLSATPIRDENGSIIAASCVTRDISDRKRIEKALRQTETKYRLLIDHTQDLVTIFDETLQRIYVSPSIEQQLGYSPAELVSPGSLEITHPEDFPLLLAKQREIFQTKQPVFLELRSRHKNGAWISFETRGIPMVQEDGTVKNIMFVSRNVTERKVSEAALSRIKKESKIIAEHTDDLILITDKHGEIVHLSPSYERVTGTSQHAGPMCFQCVHPEDVERVREQFHDLVRTLEPRTCEFRYRSAHGDWIVLEAKGAPILTDCGECDGFIIVSRDITERRNNELLLRQAEKLSVIGELAAGIAHEIRNPLTSLKGFIQLLKPTLSEQQMYADIMLSELDRINFIVSELLVLSKPHNVQIKSLSLVSLLENVLTLLASESNLKNIPIHTSFEYAPVISGEENQLKQVFINIVKNALEAIDGHGEIMLATSAKADQEVLITIADNGCGIPEELIPKLGDPFFTTKENGTGLGLMISSKIIKDHGGHLEIASKRNEGTTVKITLPIAHEQKGPS
ncbi:PAS domain-containing sensor histidine kinase [Brevibacillus agri]|uniref:PAS domain-containing sensor histidine kinase n=1 Tax=Brevibacillus agri TaxID=51101 RepID=UPI0024BF54FD|nr:PAS domain-containing sensor histidine kinase [Brevibacillus agri]WHX30220.1 PAS domain S-box protein [Brevibacillus agri]